VHTTELARPFDKYAFPLTRKAKFSSLNLIQFRNVFFRFSVNELHLSYATPNSRNEAW